MEKLILTLDQGTTSSRAILFNKNGKIVSLAQKEFTQIYPKPGWVEHDPMEIWSSQASVITEAILKENLREKKLDTMIREKTGLVPDAYFSATKIQWILNNVAGAKEKAQQGKLAFGTIDSWLIWNLTEGALHITDITNASRTMLFNINTLSWDQELLELFEIPESMLP